MPCHRVLRVVGFVLCSGAGAFLPAQAGCAADWTPGLIPGESPRGLSNAMVVFDDGTGAAVYAGVDASIVSGQPEGAVARWDGAGWTAVGALPPGYRSVSALAVFDDGAGAALHALAAPWGLSYSTLFRWDGASWTLIANLTGGAAAYGGAMAVYDSGLGPELVVGGGFFFADGNPVWRVAAWNGASWRPLGPGLGAPSLGTGETVFALAVYDAGGGPALVAAGTFLSAGGITASRVARWDGAAWNPLGTGMDATVLALQPMREGGANVLFAGGWFNTAGGIPATQIARWNGSAWSPVGTGITGAWPSPFGCTSCIEALAAFDDGNGPTLYAGGGFQQMGGLPASNIARWDGTSWSPLGPGLASASAFTVPISLNNGSVTSMVVFDGGGGPSLGVAGAFSVAGQQLAGGFARWTGSAWTGFGESDSPGRLNSFAVYDDGSGPALHAMGEIVTPGGDAIRAIVRWTGSTWQPIGIATPFAASGIQNLGRLGVYDDGTGPELYAAGPFSAMNGIPANRIARWNGTAWSTVGGGLASGIVLALTDFDDGGGSRLYVAGQSLVAGGVPSAFGAVLCWDGSTWSAVGSPPMVSNGVSCLAGFDDGGGPALYAGSWGGSPPSGVTDPVLSRWDGSGWTVLSTNNIGIARTESLEVFDDGTGPALLAGGIFAGIPLPIYGVARWSGSGWTLVAPANFGASSGAVLAIAGLDDGSGPALFAAGEFASIGGVAANRIARWTPASGWTALGAGTDNSVWDLAVLDDGFGPALFAGGLFTQAGGGGARGFARYGRSPPRILAEPRSAAVLAGGPASLRVIAGGPGPLAYQWKRNGLPIPGAVAPVHAIPSAGPADAGLYDVTVTNACGSTTSVAASLQVRSVHLRLAPDQGPGSARARITSLHPGRTALTLLSADPLNWSNPGGGTIAGLHLAVPVALAQIQTGAPPFVTALDGTGGYDLTFLPGAPPAALLGTTLYGVTGAIDPATGAILGVSAIARITL